MSNPGIFKAPATIVDGAWLYRWVNGDGDQDDPEFGILGDGSVVAKGGLRSGGAGWLDVTNPAYGDGGARGDGVTDDATAIQAAIDAAKALTSGGVVYFPPGTYNIGTQLVLWPTVHIVGAGSWFTKINYTPDSTDPAMVMGDAAWRAGGGDGTKKNWQMRGIRLQTSNGASQGSGLYIIGIMGATISDVQVTGFTASGHYGIVLSGNPSAILGESSVNVEGHYNTLVGCYSFGNANGMYIGGVSGTGQSNDNLILGGAIRQNAGVNLYLGPTDNNTIVGVSLESVGGTSTYGLYGAVGAIDNKVYGCRFEGTYTQQPWLFVNDATCKRNVVDLPEYGATYNKCDPTSASFAADPGGRNALRAMIGTTTLVHYGPNVTHVAPVGGDINFNYGSTAVARVGDANGFDGFRLLKGFVLPVGTSYGGVNTQGAAYFNTDTDLAYLYATDPDGTGAAFKPFGLRVGVPASASATGSPGHWAADASYLYICTATDTWKRVGIAAW